MKRLVGATLLTMALGTSTSHAITVTVPDDYPTLQAVMDVQYAQGIDSMTWDGHDHGAPARSGVYLVRVRTSTSAVSQSFLVRR